MGISRECRICFGRCDPGELRNGVCFECTIEMKKREKNSYKVNQMLEATEFKQLELEDYINESNKNQD